MDSAPLYHLSFQKSAEGGGPSEGFSLLEMMMVVTVILIVASIATPIYTSVVTRAREVVLRDHLIGNRE